MSSINAFDLLGLDQQTASLAEVKKAYSQKLKITRPDDDPEGFMQLREAFTYAKAVAQGNDRRAAQPVIELPVDEDDGDEEAELTFVYDEELDYEFDSSPLGKLIERTVRWIHQGGDDPNRFFAQIASDIRASTKLELNNYQSFFISYLFESAMNAGAFENFQAWETPKVAAPSWLSDDMIVAASEKINLLEFRMEHAWSAQQFNWLLSIFSPVLTKRKLNQTLPEPADVLTLIEQEQTTYRGDDHGSFYDRDEKQWIDMSPVGKAMRDIEETLKDTTLKDPATVCNDILERDELQSLDEFEVLDQRLRQFIVQNTGIHSGNETPEPNPWFSKPVILMFDDYFGWSRQFGRNHWERNEYSWLHKVIGRHRGLRPAPQHFTQTHQPNPMPIADYIAWLTNPLHLLMTYFGFRLLQLVWRLF